MNCAVLILAGGNGARVSHDIPKQYLPLNGKTILRRTIEVFLSHPQIDSVNVVISKEHTDLYNRTVTGLEIPSPIYGGKTRQQSGLNGLVGIKNRAPEYVLIHDAARPLVDHKIIDRVLQQLQSSKAVLPAIPETDTLKNISIDHTTVRSTIDRNNLWRAQTPQGFHYQEILAAHREFANKEFSDDAAIAENKGIEVALVAGDEQNIKITTKNDLDRAARLSAVKIGETRIGSGFDVHAFCKGDHIMLCGVKIDHNFSLEGHSDADVAMHAVTDALLGALALGDIGQHFPSDDKWRNASSQIFLEHVKRLISDHGGLIGNIDLTIICETPKVSPHRERMVTSLAEILDLDTSRINIKATTTDSLGFLGRGEGIAALASATIQLN